MTTATPTVKGRRRSVYDQTTAWISDLEVGMTIATDQGPMIVAEISTFYDHEYCDTMSRLALENEEGKTVFYGNVDSGAVVEVIR